MHIRSGVSVVVRAVRAIRYAPADVTEHRCVAGVLGEFFQHTGVLRFRSSVLYMPVAIMAHMSVSVVTLSVGECSDLSDGLHYLWCNSCIGILMNLPAVLVLLCLLLQSILESSRFSEFRS